jgi:hypothetical protein
LGQKTFLRRVLIIKASNERSGKIKTAADQGTFGIRPKDIFEKGSNNQGEQ